MKLITVVMWISCLSPTFFSQTALQEAQRLEPGIPVEREIAARDTHTYRLGLTSGQFLRVVIEQKGIDVAVSLIAPDGKQVADVNLDPGRVGPESLSFEVTAGGDYQIVIRA